MQKLQGNGFVSPTAGHMTVGRMISEIAEFVRDDPNRFYRLVIGTDSQEKKINGKVSCDFVTAVVIHRVGRGARYFWKKQNVKLTPALREKIYTETLISLDTAQKLVPKIREVISPAKYDFEIHIDVGPLGQTRDMIKEVTGMVSGSGFVAKTKPASWGASSVADKHT